MKTNLQVNTSMTLIDDIITTGVRKGILHLTVNDQSLSGNILHVNFENDEKEVISFGSCSYLGLEFDERLKSASKRAIDQYGTFFSSSRAYLSCRFYKELEDQFRILFGAHPVITPTTTLAHLSAIPVLIGDTDAVILDHQVHNSVGMAVNIVKTKGVHTELLRHNRMDLLEEKIRKLKQDHAKIWYLADGIYSMFGDHCPVEEIFRLLQKYPQFHFYVDDAHGMSCFGENGKGSVLGRIPFHERMVVATSLAKGFGTGGAVLLFPNPELARKVRTCGGPLITSGPLQPAVLGAALASVKIHLSDEIQVLQRNLLEKIKYTRHLIQKLGLPLISQSESAIFFIGVSLPKIGYALVQRMLNDGFYLNLGIFPAVPMKNTGVRFTITNLHTFSQIESMLHAFASHFHHILQEENMNQAAIYREFKIPAPLEQKVYHILNAIEKRSQLRVIHTQSILDIPKTEWDNLFTCSVTYNWDGLALLEASFQGNPLPESNWDFDYIIIKDEAGKVVLATSLSTSLCKDDMLAPAAVSRQIEDKRQHNNSYYLTSKLISTGNLLSGGKHLYIDKASPLWKDAFELLLEKIALLQIKYDANTVLLRDFQSNDIEMDLFLSDNAYFKITMPDNHEVNNLNWESREEYISVLSQFSKRTKRYIKQDVFRHMEKFEVQWVTAPSKEEIQYLYELYLDVNKKSYELNTFVLPFRLFENIAQNKNWEIMTLRLKPEYDNREECRPVAVTFSFINGKHYHFMLVGLDYKFQKEHKCYKQAIYRLLERAKELNLETVNLGFTASHAKQMTFAAQPIHSVGYMYAKDTYSMEVISSTHIMETAN